MIDERWTPTTVEAYAREVGKAFIRNDFATVREMQAAAPPREMLEDLARRQAEIIASPNP